VLGYNAELRLGRLKYDFTQDTRLEENVSSQNRVLGSNLVVSVYFAIVYGYRRLLHSSTLVALFAPHTAKI